MDAAEMDARQRKNVRWRVVILVRGGAWRLFGWYKFFREEPQPDWVPRRPRCASSTAPSARSTTPASRTGSSTCMPRMFPDKLPGPGGLASLGVAWEQGQELPVGFTKKTIGFPRVPTTAPLPHRELPRSRTTRIRRFVTAGPAHTNVEAYFRFLVDCGKDPRFNADDLMREIKLVTDLSWIDRLIYRFLLIPITKKRLLSARPSSNGSTAKISRTGAAGATTP